MGTERNSKSFELLCLIPYMDHTYMCIKATHITARYNDILQFTKINSVTHFIFVLIIYLLL